jgi:glycerol-3-phosphate acyltransferase PlsY
MLIWSIWMVLAYLLGSVSFALILGRMKGIDIRSFGSGNVGATNLGRALGKKWGIACFLLDLGKGLVPVLGYYGITQLGYGPKPESETVGCLLWLAVGVAAVLGHVFSIFLKFKGGKGVATSLGALLGFWPVLTVPALASAVIWYIVTKATAYVGLASVVAAASMPLLAVGFALLLKRTPGEVAVYGGVTAALAALVIIRHRSNLAKLRAGTESKVEWAQKKKMSNDQV